MGIAPEHIARAAGAIALGNFVPTRRRTYFGLPIGVSRSIDFGRTISDEEWDRLVVTLRETFSARGQTWREGGLRQWRNGNLQALLEPTPTGHRLLLTTRKGSATTQVALGVAGIMGAIVMFAVIAVSGKADLPYSVPTLWGIGGLAAIASAGIRLPMWARTRALQMESISRKAMQLPPGEGVTR